MLIILAFSHRASPILCSHLGRRWHSRLGAGVAAVAILETDRFWTSVLANILTSGLVTCETVIAFGRLGSHGLSPFGASAGIILCVTGIFNSYQYRSLQRVQLLRPGSPWPVSFRIPTRDQAEGTRTRCSGCRPLPSATMW